MERDAEGEDHIEEVDYYVLVFSGGRLLLDLDVLLLIEVALKALLLVFREFLEVGLEGLVGLDHLHWALGVVDLVSTAQHYGNRIIITFLFYKLEKEV